jgi:BirA family biotin operon repressor/biotin-[acetyl-CoA-carboxylase] ligase
MPESPYSDLSRPPLSQAALRRALVKPGALWTDVRVVSHTTSTNADLAEAARHGALEGTVLVAEHQTAGRGRLDRTWESPPRAGLTFSMLLRPSPVPPQRYGWLPLLAGVSLVDVVRRLGEIDAGLKWPNDLLVAPSAGTAPSSATPSGAAAFGRAHAEGPARPGKCAGILAEAVPNGPDPAVVLGIGLNVSTTADELPTTEATSLALAGSACVDRDPLLRAFLREFGADYTDWRTAGGDPEKSGLRADYLARCDTLGRTVRVSLPGGADLTGEAVDVDGEGRLVIDHDGVRTPVAAGDVVHLR